MAAYNPEPHRQSEARGFVGHNPAQNPVTHAQGSGVAAVTGATAGLAVGSSGNNGGNSSRAPKVSPGLAAGQGVPGEDTRAKAEKMVNAEREARGRLPVYEGMPEYFQLESKMGE